MVEAFPTVSGIELYEIHEYVRHEVATYFAWFTFYLTILFGAMGWSLKSSIDERGIVRYPTFFYCMLMMFSVQTLLAIGATIYVALDVSRAMARGASLLSVLSQNRPEPHYGPSDPVPSSYLYAVRFAIGTLAANLIFWPVVGYFVRRSFRTQTRLARIPDPV